jgi:hypothetical protein
MQKQHYARWFYCELVKDLKIVNSCNGGLSFKLNGNLSIFRILTDYKNSLDAFVDNLVTAYLARWIYFICIFPWNFVVCDNNLRSVGATRIRPEFLSNPKIQ